MLNVYGKGESTKCSPIIWVFLLTFFRAVNVEIAHDTMCKDFIDRIGWSDADNPKITSAMLSSDEDDDSVQKLRHSDASSLQNDIYSFPSCPTTARNIEFYSKNNPDKIIHDFNNRHNWNENDTFSRGKFGNCTRAPCATTTSIAMDGMMPTTPKQRALCLHLMKMMTLSKICAILMPTLWGMIHFLLAHLHRALLSFTVSSVV